jgi:DNA-binding protein
MFDLNVQRLLGCGILHIFKLRTKKGVKKMTEETNPKPAAEKTEESTLKKEAEASEKSIPETVAGEPKKTTKKPVEKKTEIIFVGNKPPMSYVLAIITALSSGATTKIMLKARGRAITTAVDVAEITSNRFVKDLKVTAIGIGTEEMPPREGDSKSRMVSIIEIELAKK